MDIIFTLSALIERGMTQAAIAKELGCAQSTVSDMASGRAGVKRPSYKLVSGLQELAQRYGLEPERRKNGR